MGSRDHAGSPAGRGAPLEAVSLSLGGQQILEDINLEIGRGEFICVVGPSGCGKTTMLRLLAGLYQPTIGRVTYDGVAMIRPRRDIAIVFQDYGSALLPGAPPRATLRSPSKRSERRALGGSSKSSRYSSKSDYPKSAKKYPKQMSGGMQQRLQIARCLAQNPTVLLMDEPCGALDAITRQALQDEILQIVGQTGATTFFVTHDLEEAIYLGDRVVGLLHPGRVGLAVDVKLSRPRDQLTTA